MTLELLPFTSEEIGKLNQLTIEDCRLLQGWLTERSAFLEDKDTNEIMLQRLNLLLRAYNTLRTAKLFTVKDVIYYGLENVFLLRSVGSKTAKEINDAVMGAMEKIR